MSKRFRISMSLDGVVAGPEQSVKNPLGIGSMRTIAAPKVVHFKFQRR